MTKADNRTKEPTEAQVEAAAKATHEANKKFYTGSMSDGYHTFDELYEYRMLYNAHAAHGWLAAGIPVVKSWRHSDGELCFGGGWFIVTATLPSGQASNHYKAEHWGLFKVPEVDLPPEYDGHTPHDAARRLRIEAEYAAPVLPSSGVDEEKLAEAWEAGCLAGGNRKHHSNMTEEQAEKAWPNPYRAEAYRQERGER